MKIKILAAIVFMAAAGGVVASKFDSIAKKTLTPFEIEKKWGKAPLEAPKFKDGQLGVRAAMAYSIVDSKAQFIGKSPKEIREILGYTDGHFINENFPAYVLEIASKNSPDTWQMVFLVNKNLKVEDVVVLSRRR